MFNQGNAYGYGYAPTEPVPTAYTPPQEEKFPATQHRDIPFSILFLLHLVGLVVILVFGFITTDSGNGFVPSTLKSQALFTFIGMIAILCAVALVISVVWLQLMKMFAKPMIYLGIAFVALSMFATAVWFAVQRIYVGAILFGIFGLLYCLYFFMARSRIDFAVETIKASVGIIQQFPATQLTSFLFLLLQIVWLGVWTLAFVNSQKFSSTSVYVSLVFLIFSFYWTFEVLKNIVHVTVSGVVATVYFMANAMPENPTLESFKRATTTSFGSICLGSLIVAAINTLRSLVRMMRSENNSLLLCLVDCILSCIDNIVRYFNHYAFCQVAIYGKTFCDAASATWSLFERSGIEAIINDSLIGGVLNAGVFIGAFLTAGVGAVIGLLFHQFNGNDVIVMFCLGLVVGFVFMSMSLQVVDSGVSCLFVCYAEEPAILRQTNPGLYQRLTETYNLNVLRV